MVMEGFGVVEMIVCGERGQDGGREGGRGRGGEVGCEIWFGMHAIFAKFEFV